MTSKRIGQFQCEFDFKGVDDARYIGMAVLDTKYIDKLEGTCKDANEQYSYHMILRGTREDATNRYRIKQLGNPERDT